jgi:hypothetical protein
VREFIWETPDNERVHDLRQHLENLERAYDNPKTIETQHYKKIFEWNKDKEFLERLREFIYQQKSQFPQEFPEEFPEQFKRLLEVMNDDRYPGDADRLDTYPQLRLRWPSIILSATGIVYCMVRFSIIVLAFSSLRSMPDSVYVTTWAKFIPDVQ